MLVWHGCLIHWRCNTVQEVAQAPEPKQAARCMLGTCNLDFSHLVFGMWPGPRHRSTLLRSLSQANPTFFLNDGQVPWRPDIFLPGSSPQTSTSTQIWFLSLGGWCSFAWGERRQGWRGWSCHGLHVVKTNVCVHVIFHLGGCGRWITRGCSWGQGWSWYSNSILQDFYFIA